LAFPPKSGLRQPEFFLWFKGGGYARFLYIDRIVISQDFRGHHLATSFTLTCKPQRLHAAISSTGLRDSHRTHQFVLIAVPPKARDLLRFGQQSVEDPHTGAIRNRIVADKGTGALKKRWARSSANLDRLRASGNCRTHPASLATAARNDAKPTADRSSAGIAMPYSVF